MPDNEIRAFYAQLGRRVRDAREAAGVTQEQLANRLGLTRGSVANLEAGRQRISAYHLSLTATTLDVPIGELAPAAEPVRSVPANVAGADPIHLKALQQLLQTAEMSEALHAAT